MTNAPKDCNDLDSNALTVTQAKEKIIDHICPQLESEAIQLHLALGRVLAETIRSPVNVPSCTNSAMDGYAIQYEDALQHQGKLICVGRALAGKPYSGKIAKGQCVRIMTGACIPDSCDTVIMQEQVETSGDNILICAEYALGQNIRAVGEDIALGEQVFQPGLEIKPPHMGVLASMGISKVHVYKKIKVGFFSTGDELQTIGKPLATGQIYDSNRYSLMAALHGLNVELVDGGIIADDRQAIRNCLQDLSQKTQIIITTGGVSVGDVDYVKDELEQLGQLYLWKIAMKPGKPLAFGKIGQCYFFGLPGNPVSVMATFYQFVVDAIAALAGKQRYTVPLLQVTCHGELKKQKGRTEFQRGILFHNEQGELFVKSTGAQGSGILKSMAQANCFIVLPANTVHVKDGELVGVQAFYGLIP